MNLNKNILFLLLIFSTSFFWSCKEDDQEGTLTIHFKAVYDGQPLQTFTTLPFENNQQLQFTHLSMFIADLELAKASGQESLRDIELVDLSYDNATTAAAGYTLTIQNVPADTYTGISFGVGVPADLNAMKPADFPSSHPLSKTAYYWEAWQSYIFSKTEGRLDTLNNGNLDLGFALHVGSDPLYSILQAAIPIEIEDGQETSLEIVVDYKILLQGIDIKSNPQNHNPSDLDNITALVNNMGDAFTLYQ
jgi:hypothetical protein